MSDDNDNDNGKKLSVNITDQSGLGAWSKPANTLINRLANGFGIVVAKPLGTIAQAKADAKAALIKTESAADVATLEGRAAIRVAHEQVREQKNLEAIVTKAAHGKLDDNATPENIDDDWLGLFVNKAKHVSKEYMQDWWARILEGEAQTPGSFSPKTLEIVSLLSQRDAEMFRDVCSFVVTDSDHTGPLVFDPGVSVYKDNGVDFDVLQHLASLDLVSVTVTGVMSLFEEKGQEVKMEGHGFSLVGKLPEDENRLIVGMVLFTQFGLELSRICEPKIVAEFPSYLIEQYEKMGIHFQLVSY